MGKGKDAYEERRELERARREADDSRAKLRAEREDLAGNVADLAMMALRDFLTGKAYLEIADSQHPGFKSVRFFRD